MSSNTSFVICKRKLIKAGNHEKQYFHHGGLEQVAQIAAATDFLMVFKKN